MHRARTRKRFKESNTERENLLSEGRYVGLRYKASLFCCSAHSPSFLLISAEGAFRSFLNFEASSKVYRIDKNIIQQLHR